MTGRKLYLDWGHLIIGIEKIHKTPEVLKQLHLEDLGDPLRVENNHAHILFEMGDLLGIGSIARKLGDPKPQEVGGREIQEYFTNVEYWTTPEERVPNNPEGENE